MLGEADFSKDTWVPMLLQMLPGSHSPCQGPGVSTSSVLPPSRLLGLFSQYHRRTGMAQGGQNSKDAAPYPVYVRIILRAMESSAQA